MKYLLITMIAIVLLMGMPKAMAASTSKLIITYESKESASGCRLIALHGPYGIDEYYRVSRLCHGNEGEYVIRYDIPVKYVK